jgi:hypothetical protein
MLFKCPKCSNEYNINKIRTVIRNDEVITILPECSFCGSTLYYVEEKGTYNVQFSSKIGDPKNYR